MTVNRIIEKIVDLSDAIQAYWDIELPKRLPDYPRMNLSDEVGPPPPEEKTLRELLAALTEEEILKIALVMYVGRGDIDADGDLSAAYHALKASLATKEWAISQMMEKASLSDFLLEGQSALNKAHVDLDIWQPSKKETAREVGV